MEKASRGEPQGSIMMLPTKMVSEEFSQQLLGPDLTQEILLITQKLAQEIRNSAMKGSFPFFSSHSRRHFHTFHTEICKFPVQSQVNESPVKALYLLHWDTI